jgi:hypothetical protein
VCRKQVINAQKIPSRIVEGLEEIAHRAGNRVAELLVEGLSVADISRRLRREYHVVWTEARKLMAAAEVVTLRPFEPPEPSDELEVLELFAELQGIVPDHVRAATTKPTG